MNHESWHPRNPDLTPEQYLQQKSKVEARAQGGNLVRLEAVFNKSDNSLTRPDGEPADAHTRPMQIKVDILDPDTENGPTVLASAITEPGTPGIHWIWPLDEETNEFRLNGVNRYISLYEVPSYGVTFNHHFTRANELSKNITMVTREESGGGRRAEFTLKPQTPEEIAQNQKPKLITRIIRPGMDDIVLEERRNTGSIEMRMAKDQSCSFPLRDNPQLKESLEKAFHNERMIVPEYPNGKFLDTIRKVLSSESQHALYFTPENDISHADNRHLIRVVESAGSAFHLGMEKMLGSLSRFYEGPDDTSVDPQVLADTLLEMISLRNGPEALQISSSEFFNRNIDYIEEDRHPEFAKKIVNTSNPENLHNLRTSNDNGRSGSSHSGHASFSNSNSGGRFLMTESALSQSRQKFHQDNSEDSHHAPTAVDERGVNAFSKEHLMTARVALMSFHGYNHEDCIVVSEDWAEKNPILKSFKQRVQIHDRETGQSLLQPACLIEHKTQLAVERWLGSNHFTVKHLMNLHRNTHERDTLKTARRYLERIYKPQADGNRHDLIQQIVNLAKEREHQGGHLDFPALIRHVAAWQGRQSKDIVEFRQLDENGLRSFPEEAEKRVYANEILYAGYINQRTEASHWLYDPDPSREGEAQTHPVFTVIRANKNIPAEGALLEPNSLADSERGKHFHHIKYSYAKTLQTGDKLFPQDGSKGVIRILPTDQMPREGSEDPETDEITADGQAMDMLVNPYSPIARTSAVLKNTMIQGNALRVLVYNMKMVADTPEEEAENLKRLDQALPWILPCSRTGVDGLGENTLLLWNGHNGTPDLPEGWMNFTSKQEIEQLEDYLRVHQDSLQEAREQTVSSENYNNFLEQVALSLPELPMLRVPSGIHGEELKELELALGIELEEPDENGFSRMEASNVVGLYISDPEDPAGQPIEINATNGWIHVVAMRQEAAEKETFRALTDDAGFEPGFPQSADRPIHHEEGSFHSGPDQYLRDELRHGQW